ncbi:hypothetical protein M8A51_08465 [Schlegelella sp. S2-27]|uniref:Uncharacterized protein n=1 Tax=Caldimonas mangrovi TaxID=2944811 RepID=A0ABT0YMH4_9BURK|nr:hypothetical protein [Caldimonas mangrovi]MCM5679564.1 hypothetical protein [Caldimonas mangrovi]
MEFDIDGSPVFYGFARQFARHGTVSRRPACRPTGGEGLSLRANRRRHRGRRARFEPGPPFWPALATTQWAYEALKQGLLNVLPAIEGVDGEVAIDDK